MSDKKYANEHPRYREIAAKKRKKRHAEDYKSYARLGDYFTQGTNYWGYPKGYHKDIDAFRTKQKERFMYGDPTITSRIGNSQFDRKIKSSIKEFFKKNK